MAARAAPAYNAAMRAVLVLALLGIGCSCDPGPPVPFGLEGQRGDVVSGEAVVPPTPTPSAETQEWPEGAAVSIGGAPLAVEGASIRSTLAIDLDADGDTDAIAVALTPTGPALFTAIHGATTFDAPSPIALAIPAADPSCTWPRIAFVAAAREATVAALSSRCGTVGSTLMVALRLDARPRVLETFTFTTDAFENASVSLSDRDGDGHDDVVLSLQVPTAADGPGVAELVYFDRPAGLSRDTAQPEASLASTAGFERPVVRRHPDRLAANARRTIALHAALCGPTAQVSIGAARGIACGASLALGHAFVALTAASAHAGDALTALESFGALDRADVTVRDADRTIARDAITGMSGVISPPAHDGPEAHAISTTAEQRLSTLAFVDEDHVWLRGRGEVVTLSTGEVLPQPAASETSLRDPSGRFTLVELRGACSGAELAIEAGVGLVDTVLSPRRTVPVQPTSAAPCTGESGQRALAVDGLRVLGWAPQGILLARRTSLTLVPLDVEARPAGDPSVLGLDAPPPAPIAPGHATADASAWAIATPLGIVVFRRAEQDARLVRPTGFTSAEGTSEDVAISPSAERIAWLEGGHLRWAALGEIASPAAPAAP